MADQPDIRQLIDEMKAKEGTAVAGDLVTQAITEAEVEADIVETQNAAAARELTRQLALVKLQKSEIEKTEKALTDALKSVIGDHKGIRAGTTQLATVTVSIVERVNTKLVAELYPSDQYPQLYTHTPQSTLYIDPDFKKSVIAETAIEQGKE